MKRTFNKPATTYQQQIAKLQQRGMIIDNPTEAAFYLQQISYYRLGAYWLPFEADHKQHTFKKGTQLQANSRYIYNTLVMILHFMNLIAPHHSWRNRFFMLIKKYNVPLAAMGFPKDWQQRAIWQTENELVGNK